MSQFNLLTSLLTCLSTHQSFDFSSSIHLINSNVGPNEIIYLINNQSFVEIQPVIAAFKFPVLISDGANNVQYINADLWYSPKPFNAFIVALCEDDLWLCHLMISKEVERRAFNPRRKLLMELVKDVSESSSEIKIILREIFLHFRSINLWHSVICFRTFASHKVQSFSFDPFGKTFLINLTDRTAADGPLYYSNKAKNMRGQPFRMSLFESPPYMVNVSKSSAVKDQKWVGYDGGMLNAIVKHFNATLQLVIPPNNDPGFEIYFNSTAIRLNPGATLDVVEGRADLVINTRPYTPSYIIEYLYPYYFNPVSIFLPKAPATTWSNSLMSQFAFRTEIALSITILIAVLFNCFLHNRFARNGEAFLEVFSYLLLISFVPTVNYHSAHRFFLITWSIFCIIILSIITGAMYSHFMVVRYKADVDSLAQLMQTDYQVPIIRQRYSLFEIYKQNNSAAAGKLSNQYWQLMPKFLVRESLEDIFGMIERKERYAFMQTNGHCEYFVAKNRFAGPHGGPIYHLMKEIVVPDNAVHIIQYGSPYKEELNALLLWFKEAGLDIYSRMRLDLKFSAGRGITTTSETRSLSIETIHHVFIIYGICLTICVMAFFAEVFWWKFFAVV